MTDRELLERAAKAAGAYMTTRSTWNPLGLDADAFALAVDLGICVQHDDPAAVIAGWVNGQPGAPTRDGRGPWFWKEWLADHGGNRYAATRRAIVRAAAAMAREGEQ